MTDVFSFKDERDSLLGFLVLAAVVALPAEHHDHIIAVGNAADNPTREHTLALILDGVELPVHAVADRLVDAFNSAVTAAAEMRARALFDARLEAVHDTVRDFETALRLAAAGLEKT